MGFLEAKELDEFEHQIRLKCHRLRKLTNAAWSADIDFVTVNKKDLDVLLNQVVRLQKDKVYLKKCLKELEAKNG